MELDVWGRATGKSFVGDVAHLREHLLHSNGPSARVSEPQVADLLLSRVDDYINDRCRTTLITLHVPWGTYRWIPRPHPHRRRPA